MMLLSVDGRSMVIADEIAGRRFEIKTIFVLRVPRRVNKSLTFNV